MSVLKRDELKGLALHMVAEACWSAGLKDPSGDAQRMLRHSMEKGEPLGVKITINDIEVDAEKWLAQLERSVVEGYYTAAREHVEATLSKGARGALDKLQEATDAMASLAGDLEDKALRLTREISEEAYWTSSSSQNC